MRFLRLFSGVRIPPAAHFPEVSIDKASGIFLLILCGFQGVFMAKSVSIWIQFVPYFTHFT